MSATTADPISAQTPLNSPTVFNFFSPDYQISREASRRTTSPRPSSSSRPIPMSSPSRTRSPPPFSRRTTSNGLTSYRSGNGTVTMDLSPYMTPAQTSNAAIPALVDKLGDLLTGGQMTPAAKTVIVNFVANTTNFPFNATPTQTQMRDRVRAVVHLIVTFAGIRHPEIDRHGTGTFLVRSRPAGSSSARRPAPLSAPPRSPTPFAICASSARPWRRSRSPITRRWFASFSPAATTRTISSFRLMPSEYANYATIRTPVLAIPNTDGGPATALALNPLNSDGAQLRVPSGLSRVAGDVQWRAAAGERQHERRPAGRALQHRHARLPADESAVPNRHASRGRRSFSRTATRSRSGRRRSPIARRPPAGAAAAPICWTR